MDETYINVRGDWKYLYRAVDKEGQTIDFLLTAKRDKKAALRFFKKAIASLGEIPEKVTIDKSGSNKAALDALNNELPKEKEIQIRQIKYLNNIIEQDHRAVKRRVRPMLNFKSFHAAKWVLAGIELMHMIRKGQMQSAETEGMSFAEQFYSLAI